MWLVYFIYPGEKGRGTMWRKHHWGGKVNVIPMTSHLSLSPPLSASASPFPLSEEREDYLDTQATPVSGELLVIVTS